MTEEKNYPETVEEAQLKYVLFEPRYEWIDGVRYMMPSPSTFHQQILGKLHIRFIIHFEKRPCKVFIAPLDVKFPNTANGKNSVLPDLFVVCDRSKVTPANIKGAPTLVVEVVSTSNTTNQKRDTEVKFQLYAKNGVPEYWLVYKNMIEVYTLIDDTYQLHGKFSKDVKDTSIVTSAQFQDLHIDLNTLFEDIW